MSNAFQSLLNIKVALGKPGHGQTKHAIVRLFCFHARAQRYSRTPMVKTWSKRVSSDAGVTDRHTPSFAGTPSRARQPACLVPLTTGHTPSRLAFSGVSVTLHTPYWECDRGYRHTQVMTTGIRVSSDSSLFNSNNCAKLGRLETPQFLCVILNRPFWTSWTFWTTLDNVQMSKPL